MRTNLWMAGGLCLLMMTGCKRHAEQTGALHATAQGAAVVEASGGKQIGAAGSLLAQPLVVQVNDETGNAVTGAAVHLQGPAGVRFEPAEGLTDSSGQLSSNVSLGTEAGRYALTATSTDKTGKTFVLKVDETALSYQEQLGAELDQMYCSRCHSSESTIERVSNFDNLATKPHAFTDGETLNKMSDADLLSIIAHGGPSLNRSALMPPYGSTLSKAELQALLAYIRLIADPPYRTAGVIYARK
jgi:mono/diheme cytochrome c family protein